MKNSSKIVGHLDKKIIDIFNLPFKVEQEIFCGESNLTHMKTTHPEDFEKYHHEIENIIKNPDYIARHPHKENAAIEYIKIFYESPDKYVLVAVRATGKNQLYARTLFVMDEIKVNKYNKCGALIPYK